MPKSEYDVNDKKSVIEYANRLVGKTLGSVCPKARIAEGIPDVFDKSFNKKGAFGHFLEKHYFDYPINSDSSPDFIFELPDGSSDSLELKSSPIKKNKNGSLVSKERLVLNVINFENLPGQKFESSDFWAKNNSLLIVFYLYEIKKLFVDYKIEFANEWIFDENDFKQIKDDWEYIQLKVSKGLAHKLSEGDTYYLGACTKGATSKNKRTQYLAALDSIDAPAPKAKQRAFSLKQGFVNHIIANFANNQFGNKGHSYGRILNSKDDLKKKNIESIVLKSFKPHLSKSVEQLANEFNFKLNPANKNTISRLVNSVLKIEVGKKIIEFEKADICVKSVVLNNKSMPNQHISFPAFEFCEIVDEDWENSSFRYEIDRKFLFIFFKEYNDDVVILDKVMFWNMPYDDIESCKSVWEKTKNLIETGTFLKSIAEDGKRKTNFPSAKNEIAHVRPHANKTEVYPLPTPTLVDGLHSYTKQSFWLNKKYIRDFIYFSK